MGVAVSYEELAKLHRQLTWIINELEDGTARRRELSADIGTPYGRERMRSVTTTFESRWDDKRAELLDDVRELHRRVRAVADGFEDWDRGAVLEATGVAVVQLDGPVR
jgi:hypothetical protein